MKYFTVALFLVLQSVYCGETSGQFALVYFGDTSSSEEAFKYKKVAFGSFSTNDGMKEFSVSVHSVESYGDPRADAYLLPEVTGRFEVVKIGDVYQASSDVMNSRELEVVAGYFEMLINGLHAPPTQSERSEHELPAIWSRQGVSLRLKESRHFSFFGNFSAETWVSRGGKVAYFLKVDSDLRLSQFSRIVDFLRSERAVNYDQFLRTFEREFSLLLNERERLPSCSVIAIQLDRLE